MEIPIENLHIGITGLPNSGRTSLASRMNNYIVRIHDGRQFRLLVDECNEPESNLQNYDIILVLFTPATDKYKTAGRLALNIKQHTTNLCVVGTKLDLVPRDFSKIDVDTRTYGSLFKYDYKLPYFAMSLQDGNTVTGLCHFLVNRIKSLDTVERNTHFSLAKVIKGIETWVLDIVATLFSLPLPKDATRNIIDILELTDKGVEALIQSPYAKNWDKIMAERNKDHDIYKTGLTAYRITPRLMAKRYAPSEAANMEYVRKNTKIPVPRPHSTHLKEYMVMDYIEGRMLLESWENLSAFMKFRIACTLRTYLKQLHRLTRDVPGTVEGGLVSGMIFENESYGPFHSSDRFQAWCEMIACTGWGKYVRGLKLQNPDHPGVPLPTIGENWEPYVFCHQDLHLGNLLLAEDKSLWLIDWSYSGFFPRCMDSVVLGFYDDAPQSWRSYRKFIAGIYPSYDRFWNFFADDIHRYRN